MTALHQYDRLEASGLWRSGPGEQRRDVVVSLGDATVTLTAPSGAVLTHWSIPAMVRGPDTQSGALFHPAGDPEETLEFPPDETAMVDALDRILAAVERRRPHPGKLRVALLGAFAAAVVGVAVFWVPGALQQTATTVVPDVKRDEIGAQLLSHMTRLTGAPCGTTDTFAPLKTLTDRVLGEDTGARLVVLPSGVPQSVHLPGGVIVLDRAAFEDHEEAGVAAGIVLVEWQRFLSHDPLYALLDSAGLIATLRLLTTGEVPDSALQAHAEKLLMNQPASLPENVILEAFEGAGLSSSPYAYAQDMTGETVLPLIEADPNPDAPPVLGDADWVRLQGICGE